MSDKPAWEVKNADIRVRKWFPFVWYWEVVYWVPGQPRNVVLVGMCKTLWGARRRAVRALGGSRRGVHVMPEHLKEGISQWQQAGTA